MQYILVSFGSHIRSLLTTKIYFGYILYFRYTTRVLPSHRVGRLLNLRRLRRPWVPNRALEARSPGPGQTLRGESGRGGCNVRSASLHGGVAAAAFASIMTDGWEKYE